MQRHVLLVLQVEWISALEGAVARIVKLVAGVDEEAEAAAAKPKSWAERLERTYASVGEAQGSAVLPHRLSVCRAAMIWRKQGWRGGAGKQSTLHAWVGVHASKCTSAAAAGSSSASRRGGSSGDGGGGSSRAQMVSIVSYDGPSGGGGSGSGARGGAGGRSGHGAGYSAGGSGGSDYSYITVDYGSIAGEWGMH